MQTFYMVKAHGTPKGGLILLHEAFGLTPHIRRQCDQFAALGYTVIAPDMLEPAAPQAEREDEAWQSDGIYTWLAQKQVGLDTARPLIVGTAPEQIFDILKSCINKLGDLPVATIGYCWGGSVSFVAAKQLPGHLPNLACAVCYYGGKIAELAAKLPVPQVPTLCHLAKLDRYIPFEAAIKSLSDNTPDVEAYAYEADHGFNRDDGPVYDAPAAKLALERTLAFFDKYLK
jgi:carboxymethylenebutenolidase